MSVTDDTWTVPDDGAEHRCLCGSGPWRVWDCDGYAPPVVVDDEGRSVAECSWCERWLVPGAKP